MSKRNVELDRLLWPKDSLKRTLLMNHPGCDSAVAAVKSLIAKQDQLNIDSPPEIPNEFQVMHDTIEELKVYLKDFDYELLINGKREELANMPTKTIDEAKAWRDAWKAAVLKVSW